MNFIEDNNLDSKSINLKHVCLAIGTALVIAGTGAMANFNASAPLTAMAATTGKHTTANYRAFNDRVMIKPADQNVTKKAYDLTGGVVGTNQPVNFKTKYKLSQLKYLTIDHRMTIDQAVYYHFTTATGQNGWIWRGYTQEYTPRYAVKNLKSFKKTVYVQTAYRQATSTKKVYDFDVIRNHTNFNAKYKLNKFKTFKVTQRMTVKNAVYYHVTSGKSTGWVWRGYTTTKKPLVNTYLAAEIKQIMTNYHLRGKVLVINGKQNNRDSEGFGYANYGRRILNNKSSVVYQGASLQKAMTGAMMVQLITESQKTSHKITQNTTINRWFPSLKNANTITVGNLLTQTSGIVDNKSELDPGYQLSEAQAVNQAVNRINQNGLASKSYRYNNDNYILLAGIIRAYTGKSYETNLKNRIIKPLGLKHTFMWNAVGSKYTKARSYKFIGKNYQHGVNPNDRLLSYIIGTGNMYTTPNDYDTFERGLQNGKILNYSDYQYLTNIKGRSSNGYSGGMYVRHNGNIKVVYGTLAKNHVGNWVQLTKTNGQGIILFTNQSNSSDDVKQAAYEILTRVL